MFDSLRKRARTVATLAVAAALTVGGVALAQGGSGGNSERGPGARSGKRMPPPPMLPGGKDLTYAQLHVQHEGEAQVIRIDQGKITAVDDSSVTLEENDGNEVTIDVDDGTKVLAGPGKTSGVADLNTGQEVTVCGPEGEAAKAIVVPPKKGRRMGGKGNGQLPPPPPGDRLGGSRGGPPQMQG